MSAGSTDQFGRRIEYLRISVTDRCNFRCAYCMPLEGLPWLPRDAILSYEEITEVVRQLAPLGMSRLRITGGEPTIRPQLSTLIAMLRAVPGIEDIARAQPATGDGKSNVRKQDPWDESLKPFRSWG